MKKGEPNDTSQINNCAKHKHVISQQKSIDRSSDSMTSTSSQRELESYDMNLMFDDSHVDYLKDYKFNTSCPEISESILECSVPVFNNPIELTPLISSPLLLDKSLESRVHLQAPSKQFAQQTDSGNAETSEWTDAELEEIYLDQLDMENYEKFIGTKRGSGSIMEQFLEFKRRSDSTSSLTPSSVFSSLTSTEQDCLSSSKLSAASTANRSIESNSSLPGVAPGIFSSYNNGFEASRSLLNGADSLHGTTSAEDMLYNLGFSDTTSFLPTRFVKDWMVKLSSQKEKERRERRNSEDELLQFIANLEQQNQQQQQLQHQHQQMQLIQQLQASAINEKQSNNVANLNLRQNMCRRKWRQQRGGRVIPQSGGMTVVTQPTSDALRRRTIDLLLKIDNTSRNKVSTKRLVRAATLDQIEVIDAEDAALMLNKASRLKQLQSILAQNQQVNSMDQILVNNRRQSLPCMNYLATLDEHKEEDASENTSSFSNSLDIQTDSPTSSSGPPRNNESRLLHQPSKAPKLKHMIDIPSIVLSEEKQVLTHQQSSASLEVEQAFSENLCKKLTELQKEEPFPQETDSINSSTNVEPAMLSIVLKDVEIGGSRRNSSSNWLQTFSKKNSSSSSPMNLFSPVTVIEVEKLDNVNDSVDSNEGPTVGLIKRLSVSNKTQPDCGAYSNFGRHAQTDARLLHSCAPSHSQMDRVVADVSLQACDGRLSPLEFFVNPASHNEKSNGANWLQDNSTQTLSSIIHSQADFGVQCELLAEISSNSNCNHPDELNNEEEREGEALSVCNNQRELADILEEDKDNLIDLNDIICNSFCKPLSSMSTNVGLLSNWTDVADASNDHMALDWLQNCDMNDSLLSSGETENLIDFDSDSASEKHAGNGNYYNPIECASPTFLMHCNEDEDESEHSNRSPLLLKHDHWRRMQLNKPDAFQTPTDNHSISSQNNDDSMVLEDRIDLYFDPISIHKSRTTTAVHIDQLYVPRMHGTVSISLSPRSLSPISKHKECVQLSLGESPTHRMHLQRASPTNFPIEKETQTELSLQNLNIFLLPISSVRKESVTNLVNNTIEKVLQMYTNAENIINDMVEDKELISFEPLLDSELISLNESNTLDWTDQRTQEGKAVLDSQVDVIGSINRLDRKFQQLSESYLSSENHSLELDLPEEDICLKLQLLENCIRNENAAVNSIKLNGGGNSDFHSPTF